MNCEKLKNIWLKEEYHAFQGWDFSHLESRWHSEPLRWEYRSIVTEHLLPEEQLLDLGTGGGEFLLSLGHPHKNTSVTEAWQPNIQLCFDKLAPLGIRVYPVQGESLVPIPDDSFDIVINRHESYDLCEIRRVLKAGGMFITQQVGGQSCLNLERQVNHELLTHQAFSMKTELPRFRDCSFLVKYSDECFPQLKFFDVGAVVFWAKTIEWSFPGFSVENNFDRLCLLQNEIVRHGFVADLQHRFIIAAQNMK